MEKELNETKIETHFYLYEHRISTSDVRANTTPCSAITVAMRGGFRYPRKRAKARNMLGGLLDQRDNPDYDFDRPSACGWKRRNESSRRYVRAFGNDYFDGKISAPLVNGRPKRETTLKWERFMLKICCPTSATCRCANRQEDRD